MYKFEKKYFFFKFFFFFLIILNFFYNFALNPSKKIKKTAYKKYFLCIQLKKLVFFYCLFSQ
ncbi:MAG: hypothetical protein EAZ44_07250 [Cytophagia bacterium]|nr:MAG: hypothetical protein EAZ44_07250 [Cytophagia bacterium]TAG41777.1 MAG: hypothetical protein EAZ31_07120 [Cytophagia bacterium]